MAEEHGHDHAAVDRTSPAEPHHHHHGGPNHDHGSHGAHGGHIHLASVDGKLPRAFAIGIALNLGFVVVEVAMALVAHSLALFADAGHNFADMIGLVLAGGATVLAQRRPSADFTYGLRASTILAALGNAMILLVVTGGIIWASIGRLQTVTPIDSKVVMGIAALGVLVNGVSALLLMGGSRDDLNVRGAYLHLLADAGVSVGVIAAAATIAATGWLWLDPVVSLVIACVILFGTWDLLRQSVRLALQAVPAGVDCQAVRAYLGAQDGVGEIHDLHIWAMSTTENAMTAHLVMPQGHPGDAFLGKLANELDQRFRLGHVTLQIETGEGHECRLATGHV